MTWSVAFSISLLWICIFFSSSSSSVTAVTLSGGCNKPAILFVFGDSNSDTGGLVSGLGFPVNLPNGRTFFHRSTGRLSDGRLVIDFLCKFFLLPISILLLLFFTSKSEPCRLDLHCVYDADFKRHRIDFFSL